MCLPVDSNVRTWLRCVKVTPLAFEALRHHTSACLQLAHQPLGEEVFDLGTALPANLPVPSVRLQRDDPRSSEDCLHLNVWTSWRDLSPTNSTKRDNNLLPVMVWVHGGMYQQGATSDPGFNGASLAVNSNVVVVSIAYRLGPFGFFRHEALDDDETDDDNGNWGLQDQRAALQWVRSNIVAFGGDPERVLLVGGSTDAVSVCLHLISPRSCGLFAAAAMHSGFCDATPPKFALACGVNLTNAVNCSGGNDTAQCLRSLDVRGESPF